MESNLFKGITDRVNRIVSSPEFEDLEVSESDVELLMNAQRDLIRLIDNPKEVERVLRRHPLRDKLLQITGPAGPASQQSSNDATTDDSD
jgi:hypothetical protein